MASRVGRKRVVDDVAVGDCSVLLVGDDGQIEGGFEPGFIKAREHHACVRTFELRDRIGPPRGLAQVKAAQSGSEFA